MPARNERLLVNCLRPWTPAENEPAEPKALMQSEQLIWSLTPSSTEPSTWLVIIWLKRWLARPPIDAPLESAPVGVGEGVGVGDGLVEGDGLGVGDGLAEGVGVGAGVGEGRQSPSQELALVITATLSPCAAAVVSTATSEAIAVST